MNPALDYTGAGFLGPLIAAALEGQRNVERQARLACADELVRQVAPLMRESEARVFDALTYVPDRMLDLLESPHGWAELASHLAADLGACRPAFFPSIH